MLRLRARVLGCLVVGALAAASLAAAPATQPTPRSGSRPTAPRERAVPFSVGERLSYDVTWSGTVTAGTMTVTVQDRRESLGGHAYYITAEGKPGSLVAALYPVYYKADTLLDTTTLLPQRGSLYSDEKGRRRYRVARFDHASRSVHYELQNTDPPKVISQSDLPTPPQAQDALSVIFALRTMPLAAGASTPMPVVVNGHVYRVLMTVEGRERVQSGIGESDAWRIAPTLVDERDREDGRDMMVWISADGRRLPLRLQAALPVGSFVLTLTSTR